MKRLYFIFAIFAFVLSGCTESDENTLSQGDPINFSATFTPPTTVLDSSTSEYGWSSGDVVGVFVGATREMPYEATSTGSTTTLNAAKAGIPSSFGDMAYAYYPGSGRGDAYVRASINVPNTQTVTDGKNPNRLVMASSASVVDGSADFTFIPMSATIELGLMSSDDNVQISKLKIEIPNPSASSYISGSQKIDFTTDTPTLARNISSGSNSIDVNFAQPIQLSTTPIFVPIGVLPFSTDGGGVKITLYDQDNFICSLDPIWLESNEISDEGSVNVGVGERVVFEIDDIKYSDFSRPIAMGVKLIDNKTGNIVANREVDIYSINGIDQTLIQTLTSNDQGIATIELNPGKYRAYSSQDGVAENKMWNEIDFEVADKQAASVVDFRLYEILFSDDFEWIESDMHPTITLKHLIESVSPPLANTTNGADWGSCKQEAKDIIAAKGWEFSKWVYLRPGVLGLGKTNGTGWATTPKSTTLVGENEIEVTVDILPWHTIKSGAWTLELAELYVEIVGPGSLSETEDIKIHNTDIMQTDAPSTPMRLNRFKFPIYGATSDTQVKINNKRPSDLTTSVYRLMVEQIKISKK